VLSKRAQFDHLTALVLDFLIHPADDSLMDPVQGFGKNLRAARLEKGWSQEKLGKEAGLASVQISRVERGVRNVQLTTLVKLIAALDVDPDVLLKDLC
jgi:DNA-binding Xre family transcriptional regulator